MNHLTIRMQNNSAIANLISLMDACRKHKSSTDIPGHLEFAQLLASVADPYRDKLIELRDSINYELGIHYFEYPELDFLNLGDAMSSKEMSDRLEGFVEAMLSPLGKQISSSDSFWDHLYGCVPTANLKMMHDLNYAIRWYMEQGDS